MRTTTCIFLLAFGTLVGSAAAAPPVPGLANMGTWQFRIDQDPARAQVYVAEYAHLTNTLGLRCGGLGGAYVEVNVGSTILTTAPGQTKVNVTFDFEGGQEGQRRRPLTITNEGSRITNAV